MSATFSTGSEYLPVMGLCSWRSCFFSLLHGERFCAGQSCCLLRKLHTPRNCSSCVGGQEALWLFLLRCRVPVGSVDALGQWLLSTLEEFLAIETSEGEKKMKYLDITTRVWSWAMWEFSGSGVPQGQAFLVFSFFFDSRKFSKRCWEYSKVDLGKRMVIENWDFSHGITKAQGGGEVDIPWKQSFSALALWGEAVCLI